MNDIADGAADGAVVAKAARRAAERLGVTGPQLARIIAGDETPAGPVPGTAHLAPGSPPLERALLFVRTCLSLETIVGGDLRAAAHWLTQHNLALDARPIEAMATLEGLSGVASYLETTLSRS